jgi:hypothetical protein
MVTGRRHRRVAIASAAAALIVVTTLTAGPSAVSGLPILSLPGLGPVPAYVGASSTAAPLPPNVVPQNPYMSPNGTNNIHNDAYASDTYAGSGPRGRAPSVNSAFYGLNECATLTFDSLGRIVGLCIDTFGPKIELLDPTTLAVISAHVEPGRDFSQLKNPLTNLCGGAYFYLDNHDRVVVATTTRTIQVVAETGPGRTDLQLQREYDLQSLVPKTDCLLALMPDWAGNIWFVTSDGVVGDVNPVTGAAKAVTLPGEIIDNSFATDETGGVFIASDHAMYRFDVNAAGAPVITWRQAYDRGTRQKPGQLAQGTGTTPTLVGSDYVAITDNAEPRMHVLVYKRGKSSHGALVCGAAVFESGLSDTENSLVSVGHALFVENNYGYTSPAATLLGNTTQPGLARVDFTPSGRCTVAWTSNEVAPTSVAKASTATGLLYAYTKPKNALLTDAWYLTAIDMRTGRTVFSQLTGTGPGYNNHYAAIFLRNGDAYIPTLTGLVRVHDTY